jgi:hypothetical protein
MCFNHVSRAPQVVARPLNLIVRTSIRRGWYAVLKVVEVAVEGAIIATTDVVSMYLTQRRATGRNSSEHAPVLDLSITVLRPLRSHSQASVAGSVPIDASRF